MHETICVQVRHSVALLLNVQINEFHPGIIVVQLWPEVRVVAQDGCQLLQLPFLRDKERRVNTFKKQPSAGELVSGIIPVYYN